MLSIPRIATSLAPRLVACSLLLVTSSGCPMPADPLASPPQKKAQVRKLESAPPDCLELRRKTIGGFANLREAVIFDVDSDGRMEMVVPIVDNTLQILDLWGKRLETVRLRVPDFGLTSDLGPFPIDGRTHWVGVFTDLVGDDRSNLREVPSVKCFSRKGKELWTYTPEIPEKESADIDLATGRLREPAKSEILVTITLEEAWTPSAGDDTSAIERAMASRHGHLVVLDAASGEILCQLATESQIELVQVVASANPAEPDQLFIGMKNEIVRCDLSRAVATQPTSSPVSQPTEPEGGIEP